MASRKQTILKKNMAQALNHLDKATVFLADLHDVFEPTHESYANYLNIIIGSLLTSREWILDFWEKAWGKKPDDYQTWRQ